MNSRNWSDNLSGPIWAAEQREIADQIVEQRKRRRRDAGKVLIVMLPIAIGLICWAFRPQYPSSSISGRIEPGTVTFTLPNQMQIDLTSDQKSIELVDKSFTEPLREAREAWEQKIGPLGFTITLLRSNSWEDCGGHDSIACADTDKKTIRVARVAGINLKTVFMHEIGHLLGVPHITNDALMSPVYFGILDTPTPFAIALAKEVQKEKLAGSKK